MNDVLAVKLGLSDIEKYGENDNDPMPMGRIGELPEEMTADEFAEYIAKLSERTDFGMPHPRAERRSSVLRYSAVPARTFSQEHMPQERTLL